MNKKELKPGTLHSFKKVYGEGHDCGDFEHVDSHSSEAYAKRDAAAAVASIKGPEIVYIVKVVAVVRRSAQVEE
jgi:hypothetical protein